MKSISHLRTYVLILFFSSLTLTTIQAQVGIGTIAPNSDALLDIFNDPAEPQRGLLFPRLALTTDSSTAAPLTAHVEGMVIYNTATVGDVTPGYYFNTGSAWARVSTGGVSNDWSLTGNTGTTAANYVGTNDDNGLRFRTSGVNAFVINGSAVATDRGRLRSFNNGTAALPVYSWTADSDMGLYRIGTDILGVSTAGTERLRIAANGDVGIGTVPTEDLHVNGNVRIDGALMPNNIVGTTGQILTSAGAGVAPIWGPSLSNVTDITRYLATGPNIAPNTIYSLTVTIAGVSAGSTGIVTITGNWSTAIFDDITIHNIEMRTGEVRFAISNNTTTTTYPAMQYNITIIR